MKNFKIFTRGLIFNDKKEVLLVQKNEKQKIAPGKNLFPGGSVKFLEEPYVALKREIMEEVGLQVLETRLFDTQTIIIGETHWIGIYYICKVKNIDFKNMEPEKHSKVFWGGIGDMEEHGKNVLEKYMER